MTVWKRVLMWTVAVGLLAGVVVYVAVVGTDEASQTTGIAASVAGVVALVMAIATEVRAHRAPAPEPAPAPAPQPPAAPPRTYGGDHNDFSQAKIQGDATGKKEEHHHHYGPSQGPPTP